MATKKKKAESTTLTDAAVREQGGTGTAKDLVPYHRGEIARCSIQPYKADHLEEDKNAPKAPGMAEQWDDVTPDFPSTAYFEKVGDFLTGTYVGTKSVQANGKDTTLYLVEVGQGADAERIAVWDCTSLSLKMAKVKIGRRVLIQLIGMRPSRNFSNPWYDFRVRTPKN
jgi:hypothetical protein